MSPFLINQFLPPLSLFSHVHHATVRDFDAPSVTPLASLNDADISFLFTTTKQEEDELQEIDPSAILPSGARRSTRGVKVDYSSAEALQKAGLKADEDDAEDAGEDSFVATEDGHDD